MNIKITTLILSLFASTSALSSVSVENQPEGAVKGFYQHETYIRMSNSVYLGCESAHFEDEDLIKKTVISVRSKDFIALPDEKITATFTFDDDSYLEMVGASTRTTEVKFSYAYGMRLSKDVYDVLKSVAQHDSATVSIYAEDNDLILSDDINLKERKTDILKMIDLCLPDVGSHTK